MSLISADGKKAVTRRGQQVRVLCTDAPGDYPIVGICEDGEVASWQVNGKFNSDISRESTLDLVEFAPPPPTPLEAAARRVVEEYNLGNEDAPIDAFAFKAAIADLAAALGEAK